MSSTFVKDLRQAICTEDASRTVCLLEAQVSAGLATDGERLLLAVLTMLPPFGNYESAALMLQRELGRSRKFEAAVWDAYRYSVLLPDGPLLFHDVLTQPGCSAVAQHMLSRVAGAQGRFNIALEYNRASRCLWLFPFNLVDGIERDLEMSDEDRFLSWLTVEDLVISRTAESDPPPQTTEGALRRQWDNLILGTRLTSVMWNAYRARIDRIIPAP